MYKFNDFYKCITYMTAQGGVRQDFLHVQAYNIMHTLTYTSDFNFVTPCFNCLKFTYIYTRKQLPVHYLFPVEQSL